MHLHINTEIDKIAAVYRDVRQVFLKASNFKLIDKDVATFVDIASLNYDWFVYTYSVKDSFIVKVDGEEDFLYETYYIELTCNSFSDELAWEITKAFEEYCDRKLYYKFRLEDNCVYLHICENEEQLQNV